MRTTSPSRRSAGSPCSRNTDVLGVRVTVEKIELRDDNRIVAVCRRGKQKQSIAITDLPLSTPKPPGAEWIEAYCHWRGRQ